MYFRTGRLVWIYKCERRKGEGKTGYAWVYRRKEEKEKKTYLAHRLLTTPSSPDAHPTVNGFCVMRPPHASPHHPYELGATIWTMASPAAPADEALAGSAMRYVTPLGSVDDAKVMPEGAS